jgi:threonylcarbamoyladenosine tRNA methylthiotransferase MtaB
MAMKSWVALSWIAWAIWEVVEAMQNTYVVRTLGCKANLYDSQLIEAELQSRGWKPFTQSATESAPSLCIVNSCTVTDEADRQSRKLASRLSRENPEARVVVTGCGAEVDPERLASSKGIDYVVGNQDKPRMVDLILDRIKRPRGLAQGEVLGGALEYGELLSRHPMDREWPLPQGAFGLPPIQLEGHSGTTRAFVKIQEGCNSFCTYCIIPYGRGPSRSLHPREVVAHARELVAGGVREIVITGTNIGDYGIDWGMEPGEALPELFERILNETGLERLRVGSLDPVEITDGLLLLMERDPRFCPHFHVSLQAAHPRILRLMKRKYGVEQARDRLSRIAAMPAPLGGAFVGMDVITGFPGETEEEFEAGFEELSKLPWSRLHVFPYSERAGTPATRLPGSVRPEVRVARTRRLGELSMARVEALAQRVLIGSLESGVPLPGVLLEKPMSRVSDLVLDAALKARLLARGEGALWANGYTANYLRVLMPVAVGGNSKRRPNVNRNEIVSVRPVAVAVDRAQGEAVLIAAPVAAQ